MANPEHLQILKQGVKTWNAWRKKNPEIIPNFFKANLNEVNLRKVNLNGANLCQANLSRTNLSGANLGSANLSRADLLGAILGAVNLRKANLKEANLGKTYLRIADIREACFHNADLSGADLGESNLSDAILTNANLIDTNFSGAIFSGANLSEATLTEADLRKTNLNKANFSKAVFWGTNLSEANLQEADFYRAVLWQAIFFENDLSQVKNLDTCIHLGPSSIDQTTLVKSGKLSEKFLRGCGLSDGFIHYLPALFWHPEPFQFYSCFISYSSKDEEFAQRLHADLQNHGVRCWFAPEDLKIGDRIRPVIDETIRIYDKLLLILSEHSMNSQWVEQEVETALDKERKSENKSTVLFPIRLDNAVMEIEGGWAQYIRNTRHIGDFTRWKDHDAYRKSFERLMRDLKGAN